VEVNGPINEELVKSPNIPDCNFGGSDIGNSFRRSGKEFFFPLLISRLFQL